VAERKEQGCRWKIFRRKERIKEEERKTPSPPEEPSLQPAAAARRRTAKALRHSGDRRVRESGPQKGVRVKGRSRKGPRSHPEILGRAREDSE